MPPPITAIMLYDLVQCPHRVTMDLIADPADRDEVSPFVQLLWERGHLYEREVIEGLRLPFSDLSAYAGDEKERLTLEAMRRGEPLIYGGRIRAADLLGNPDLLRRDGDRYVAGDIKSGAGEEGGGDDDDDDEGKPKKHYAVQLGLYTDILEQLGLSAGRRAFVWDIHGDEVPYDFTVQYGVRNPRTLWEDYQQALGAARSIVARQQQTRPAHASICKQCVWYTACLKRLEADDDLSLIPDLGRSKRDVMIVHVASVKALAASDPAKFLITKKKTVFARIGPDSLAKFHTRARLLSEAGAKPFLKAPIVLPASERELFFDIEVDPLRGVCYLHGFVERRAGDNATESFFSFFAEEPTPAAEESAFRQAWAFIQAAQPCVIYYYSKYERTIYRVLQRKYPEVCSADDIEALFDPAKAIDLYYDVVLKATEWPTRDYSIKTLAKHLGFAWRDTHPSGAASIQWFDEWVKARDPKTRARILEYNEDDCRATRVLLDGIRELAA
nr:TM0106 family RecB-like putative nuclease [Nitrosomonas nitrosa]